MEMPSINENSLDKQDKILSTIGLKRVMVWTPNIESVYDRTKFINYVTSDYKKSKRKEYDEIYSMSELNLFHIYSGLRLRLTTHESYDGETVTYKVIRMFVLTSSNKELEVIDADFESRNFYTKDLIIPFDKANRVI